MRSTCRCRRRVFRAPRCTRCQTPARWSTQNQQRDDAWSGWIGPDKEEYVKTDERMFAHLRLSPDGTRIAANVATKARTCGSSVRDGALAFPLTSDLPEMRGRCGPPTARKFFTTAERKISVIPADRSKPPEIFFQLPPPQRLPAPRPSRPTAKRLLMSLGPVAEGSRLAGPGARSVAGADPADGGLAHRAVTGRCRRTAAGLPISPANRPTALRRTDHRQPVSRRSRRASGHLGRPRTAADSGRVTAARFTTAPRMAR